MDDLKEIFPKLIVKKQKAIKNICAPLQDCLDIPFFCYGRVEADGRFVNFVNCPEIIEIYYHQKLYLEDHHLTHPSFFRSGTLFIPGDYNPEYIQKVSKQAGVGNIVFILLHSEKSFEGFFFGSKANDPHPPRFINALDLLYNFTRYFKREAEPLIERALREDFNVKKTKGDGFLQPSSSPLSNRDPQIKKFLDVMVPLTRREKQCLELFKEGKTAQMTGSILGLSQRTVESYFENIKQKLGCSTKSDLLHW